MISWFLRHPELALVTMIGSLASILVCTILIVRVTGSAADRIAYGTTVGGVEVGGLGREEAERLVASRIPAPRGRIEIIIPGRRRPMVLPVARVRPTPSIREAIDRAVEPPSIAYRIRRELGLGGRRHFPVTFRLRRLGRRRPHGGVEGGRAPRPIGTCDDRRR